MKRLGPRMSAGENGGLTTREHDVLVLVAEGKTNREIGVRLFVSSRTVQKHLEHIYEKFGVSSRTAAAMTLVTQRGEGGVGGPREPGRE